MSAMNWLAAQLTWERRLAELRSGGDSVVTDTPRRTDDEVVAQREAA